MARFPYYGTNGRCELGDLLIVHDHLGSGARRRAVLCQAKMSSDLLPIARPNHTQQYFYSGWPNFRLVGRGGQNNRASYKGGDRNLRRNHSGFRYLLVENAIKPYRVEESLAPSVFAFERPNPVSRTIAVNAGVFLSYFVLGKRGYGRTANTISAHQMSHPLSPNMIAPRIGEHHHWSITVEELLQVTAAKIAPRNVSNTRNVRGNTVSFVQSGEISRSGGSGNRFTDIATGDHGADVENPEGISILLIETSGEGF